MSAAESSIPTGLAIPRPAMSGAEPWTGSKRPGPVSERLADGARPMPPVSDAARSLRMSPNMFSVTITSNWSVREHQLHRRVVDEHVLELDVLVVGRHLGHDAPPHARRVEDVRLVDGHDPLLARSRELEAAAGDPLDLARVVLHRVVDRSVLPHAALPEVEPADELAHDEDVDLPLLRGAQVRVDVELGAKAEHALLRTHLGRVELGVADRALEDGLRCLAGGERLLRERVARVADRLRSERVLLELEVGGDLLESAKRLPHHLGADPVAGKHHYRHVSTPSRSRT